MSKKTTLLDRATDAAETAREAAVEFVEGTARPALQDAAHRAQERAVPLMAAGATMAAEKAARAKDLADAKAAELTGRKKKRSKMTMMLLIAALAGVAAVIARRLTSKSDWVSYAPASVGPTAGQPASDEATTPEDPAETFQRDVIDPDGR